MKKDAYQLKQEAMEHFSLAALALIDADGMLGHTSAGAAFLDEQARRVQNIYNELHATCTPCGQRVGRGVCGCKVRPSGYPPVRANGPLH